MSQADCINDHITLQLAVLYWKNRHNIKQPWFLTAVVRRVMQFAYNNIHITIIIKLKWHVFSRGLIFVSDVNLPVSHDQNILPHNQPTESLEPCVANDVPIVASTSKDCNEPVTPLPEILTHVTAAPSRRSGKFPSFKHHRI